MSEATTLNLVQHFQDADYTGHFGWLCGYSADADFLEDALERFSQQPSSARKSPLLLGVLDYHHLHIAYESAPGFFHLQFAKEQGYLLLHAKVALLGFRETQNPELWRLRLLVSTGNWTRESLNSLDLIWRIDLDSEALENPDNAVRQKAADILAAVDFLTGLQGQTNMPSEPSVEERNAWLKNCLEKIRPLAKGAKPRFFDNRKQSLLSQLPNLIDAHAGSQRRSFIGLGSGFFSGDEQAATSLKTIVHKLQKKGLLTDSVEKAVFLNPENCQGLANASVREDLKNDGYDLYAAHDPERKDNPRSLHAKFIISANTNAVNEAVSTWIYLGSGNLTGPGFLKEAKNNQGNLEAGVVFSPGRMSWDELQKRLPMQWDEEINKTAKLEAGEPSHEPEEPSLAPPVAYLKWKKGRLKAPEEYQNALKEPVYLVLSNGEPFRLEIKGVNWPGEQPRSVEVLWNDQQNRQSVPVVDELGRFASGPPTPLSLAAALDVLKGDVLTLDEDHQDDVSEDAAPRTGPALSGANRPHNANYPVRQMMQLIEVIGERQCAQHPNDWSAWCRRLQDLLGRLKDDGAVRYFREVLEIDPLPVLCRDEWLPEEGIAAEHRNVLRKVVHEIQQQWRVIHLENRLGEES